jgi:hypothetical protein
MSTQQILIRLPEDVAARFRAAVPARQRNKFVADLVAKAILRQEDELSKIAVAVSDEERRNPALAQEMRDWEATIGDGMEERAANAKPQAR